MLSGIAKDEDLLASYRPATQFMRRHRKACMIALAFVSSLYGIVYALSGTQLLMQLAIPLVFVTLIIIWILPESSANPSRLMDGMLFGFILALLCWPDYLALAIPGLPWITATRLVAIPLALIFLVSLSQYPQLRQDIRSAVSAAPLIWKGVAGFAGIAFLSIFFSKDLGLSASKFAVALLNWIMMFFVAVAVINRPGTMRKLIYILLFSFFMICLIGLWESRLSALPWAGHIPDFLKVEDPSVQRMLTPKSRSTTGIYRVQSKFTTPLNLAEFISYTTPFLLHLSLRGKSLVLRGLALTAIPLAFYVAILTDARIGMVGFFCAIVLYGLFIAADNWQRKRDSVWGPAAMLAYPFVAVMFLISTFAVQRLRVMVWGGGAQSPSTEARQQQIAEGIPMVWSNPWGYGIGRSGETLGFTNPAGIMTIDTYYLGVALEFGVLGFIVYFGTFICAIGYGARTALRYHDNDTEFLAPLTIALINFVIIKLVFSQLENHPLIFVLLGAAVALIYRIQGCDWEGSRLNRSLSERGALASTLGLQTGPPGSFIKRGGRRSGSTC